MHEFGLIRNVYCLQKASVPLSLCHDYNRRGSICVNNVDGWFAWLIYIRLLPDCLYLPRAKSALVCSLSSQHHLPQQSSARLEHISMQMCNYLKVICLHAVATSMHTNPALTQLSWFRVEHIISDAAENVATITDEKTEVHVLQPDEALPPQALSAPPKPASQVSFVAIAFMAGTWYG